MQKSIRIQPLKVVFFNMFHRKIDRMSCNVGVFMIKLSKRKVHIVTINYFNYLDVVLIYLFTLSN